MLRVIVEVKFLAIIMNRKPPFFYQRQLTKVIYIFSTYIIQDYKHCTRKESTVFTSVLVDSEWSTPYF